MGHSSYTYGRGQAEAVEDEDAASETQPPNIGQLRTPAKHQHLIGHKLIGIVLKKCSFRIIKLTNISSE